MRMMQATPKPNAPGRQEADLRRVAQNLVGHFTLLAQESDDLLAPCDELGRALRTQQLPSAASPSDGR